jgi:hypothetical protein
MRRLLAGVAVAAASIFASISAHAQVGTSVADGNLLYKQCTTPNEESFGQGVCRGYVMGLYDAMLHGASIEGWSPCIPAGVTVGQVVDAARQFLTSHPERRDMEAAALVAEALAKAFPCR